MHITIDQVHIARVLTALQQQPTGYRLEAVEGLCPDLTVDQVFLAIDYLSRTGQVRLTVDAHRTYWVTAVHPADGDYSLASSAGVPNMTHGPNIS